MLDINFPLILVIAVFGTGIVWVVDLLFLSPKRKKIENKHQEQLSNHDVEESEDKVSNKSSGFIESVGSLFPILLLVLILRSFFYEPFQIPSGSMIPSLEVGDFILVNKYTYGLRLPVLGTKIWSVNDPERGEVMVFKEPKNPHINFIKRVVGIPGDVIQYRDKRITINGHVVPENFVAQLRDNADVYRIYDEKLHGYTHKIRKDVMIFDMRAEGKWVVPEGHYFMMGDNRDRSNDSRYWGFVPEQNIVGKAVYVWLHWPNWSTIPNFKNSGAVL